MFVFMYHGPYWITAVGGLILLDFSFLIEVKSRMNSHLVMHIIFVNKYLMKIRSRPKYNYAVHIRFQQLILFLASQIFENHAELRSTLFHWIILFYKSNKCVKIFKTLNNMHFCVSGLEIDEAGMRWPSLIRIIQICWHW